LLFQEPIHKFAREREVDEKRRGVPARLDDDGIATGYLDPRLPSRLLENEIVVVELLLEN
jgi:hypothetical protein